MRKLVLILSSVLLFLFSIYVSPSFATNVYAPAPCEDSTSHCDASGLSYDASNCKESCIDGDYCFNSFVGTCSLQVGPQGYTCNYRYQDSPKPSCGECGVPTCSGGTGWWCKPDDTKCSGGKVCGPAGSPPNTCACPSGTTWNDAEKKCKTPTPTTCTAPSSYTTQSSCASCNYYWCASPNTPSNTCVQDSTKCTAPAACAASSTYTTSSACTGAVSGTGSNSGYFWCASPNTPSNTCVQSAVNCAAYSGSCSAYNGDAGNCNSAGGC